MQPPATDSLTDRFAAWCKHADLKPGVVGQPHQQRVVSRINADDPRLLVYHGLGSGKSLTAIMAGEEAKQQTGEPYGVVAPASLGDNFRKELDKFTTDPSAEVMSYTGAGMGKEFKQPVGTLIVDESARLRNPSAASTAATMRLSQSAKRLLLLTGTPIVNSPSDLAVPLSMLTGDNISPQAFDERFVGERDVSPGWLNYVRGVAPGREQYVKNEDELRELLKGRVDYQPPTAPEGVTTTNETIEVPMTAAQQRIQHVIRQKIPTSFLWKLDRQFPLSREESTKLNSFLVGLRQSSLSTRPFQSTPDDYSAFQQSGKLQAAMGKLQGLLDSDPRKKAIIYSNFIGGGLSPYLEALKREGIPAGMYHGGLSREVRKANLEDYNAGKLRALLIGPAGAEGISTKGTNLIQLLDPHWNEARSSQAAGRGLRFDSHTDLPPELKDVQIQRFVSKSEEPSWLKRQFGYKRERTGDEIVTDLSARKEALNELFRGILKDVGTQKTSQQPQEDRIYTYMSQLANTPGPASDKAMIMVDTRDSVSDYLRKGVLHVSRAQLADYIENQRTHTTAAANLAADNASLRTTAGNQLLANKRLNRWLTNPRFMAGAAVGAGGLAAGYGLYNWLRRDEESTAEKLNIDESKAVSPVDKASADRCWKGYEPTPGKTPYSDGSCQPKGTKKKKKKPEKQASDRDKLAFLGAAIKAMAKTTAKASPISPKLLSTLTSSALR